MRFNAITGSLAAAPPVTTPKPKPRKSASSAQSADATSPDFLGHKEPGTRHGAATVSANLLTRKEANAFTKVHGGEIHPYRHGKYARGFVVLGFAQPQPARPECVSASSGKRVMSNPPHGTAGDAGATASSPLGAAAARVPAATIAHLAAADNAGAAVTPDDAALVHTEFIRYCDAHATAHTDWRTAWQSFWGTGRPVGQPPTPTTAALPVNVITHDFATQNALALIAALA